MRVFFQNLFVVGNSALAILAIMVSHPIAVGPAFFIGMIFGGCAVFCVFNAVRFAQSKNANQ